MIALLSELLRYALKDSGEQEIPLREELRLLRLYLEILEIRYQGRLHTEIDAEAGVLAVDLPEADLAKRRAAWQAPASRCGTASTRPTGRAGRPGHR